MKQDVEEKIVQFCQEINEKCEVKIQNFGFSVLKTRKWYLTILEILFPHLEQKLAEIRGFVGEAKAINQIVKEINGLDQLQKVEINGGKVVFGDVDEISHFAQIIEALLEIVTEQVEEENEEGEGEDNSKSNQRSSFYKNNLYSANNGEKQKQRKSMSDNGKPKSVQAIVNQFNKADDDQESQSPEVFQDMYPKQSNKKFVVENIYEAKEKQQKNFKQPHKQFPVRDFSEDTSQQQYLEQKLTQKKNKDMRRQNSEKKNTLAEGKQKKKLVTHPKTPQTLKKAKSNEQIIMTKKVQENIEKTKKKVSNIKSTLNKYQSPLKQFLKGKSKQFEYKTIQRKKQKKQRNILKTVKNEKVDKKEKRIQKILNFQKQQLARQKLQYEEGLKMKLLNERERYVKKINDLILHLEKQKLIQDRRDSREEQIKNNAVVTKRFEALEKQYRDKLNILRENRKSNSQKRLLVRTGHKQIVQQIQRDLKRQNEQKLLKLTQKYRAQKNNIETDFEQLKQKIIKVYHNN